MCVSSSRPSTAGYGRTVKEQLVVRTPVAKESPVWESLPVRQSGGLLDDQNRIIVVDDRVHVSAKAMTAAELPNELFGEGFFSKKTREIRD